MRTHLVAYLRDHVRAVPQQVLLNLLTKHMSSNNNHQHLLLMHKHATTSTRCADRDQTRTGGHGHHKWYVQRLSKSSVNRDLQKQIPYTTHENTDTVETGAGQRTDRQFFQFKYDACHSCAPRLPSVPAAVAAGRENEPWFVKRLRPRRG